MTHVPSSSAAHPTPQQARLFRALVRHAADVVAVLDADGTVRYISLAIERVCGYRPEELIGTNGATLMHPDDVERIWRGYAEMARTQSTRPPVQFRARHRDGSWREVETIANNRLHDPEVGAIIVTMRDVTERVRAERRGVAFSALGQQLSTACTAADAAQVIATTADDLIGWDAFSLQLYDPDTDTLHAVLNIDIIDNQRTVVPPGVAINTPTTIARRTMTEGGQLILRPPSFAQPSDLYPFGDTSRLSASLMFVPTRRGTTMHGILSVHSYTPYAYTADDLAVLQALADHAGGALERTRAEAALRASEARHRAVVDSAFDPIITFDTQSVAGTDGADGADGTIRSYNRAAERVFGYIAHEAVGQSLALLMPSHISALYRAGTLSPVAIREDGHIVEATGRRKDGTEFPMEMSVTAVPDVPDADTPLSTAIIRDITERKAFEARLAHLATHDPLTALPNRTLFAARLADALTRGAEAATPVALLALDLDNFKRINDTWGHAMGDAVLVAVVGRLTAALRPGDTLARIGGEEFAVLAAGADESTAHQIAERLLASLTAPLTVKGHALVIGASIGIAIAISPTMQGVQPAQGTGESEGEGEGEELLRRADTALYHAKTARKGYYAVAAP